jgi:hypothetical protein
MAQSPQRDLNLFVALAVYTVYSDPLGAQWEPLVLKNVAMELWDVARKGETYESLDEFSSDMWVWAI